MKFFVKDTEIQKFRIYFEKIMIDFFLEGKGLIVCTDRK